MDSTAITQIQETAHIPEMMEMVTSNSDTPVALLPPGYTAVSMEEHCTNANHFRMKYKTTSIPDYLEYCMDYAATGAGCFVDAQSMSAKAIFDIGEPHKPGHKFHTAALEMQKTAAYKALLQMQGKRLSQRDAAEFIEDWADTIIAVQSDGSEGTAKDAAKGLRAITIDTKGSVETKVGDMGQHMTAMEKIEANNANTIPPMIIVTCAPYHGLKERAVHLRVQISFPEDHPNQAVPGGPIITLRYIGKEEVEEMLAEEMKELIMDGLNVPDMRVRIGSVS